MFLASVETTSLPFNTCAGQLKSSPISVSNIDWSSQNDFYILDMSAHTDIPLYTTELDVSASVLGIKLPKYSLEICNTTGSTVCADGNFSVGLHVNHSVLDQYISAHLPIDVELTVSGETDNGPASSCVSTEVVPTTGLIVSCPYFQDWHYNNLYTWWLTQYPNQVNREDYNDVIDRFSVFKEHTDFILEHNSIQSNTFRVGHNQFSHLPNEEFILHLGLYNNYPIKSNSSYTYPSGDVGTTMESIDWRDHNAVTPVKNQGQCGSCWSFSTTGALEGAYAIKYGKLVAFSEQELVSCDSTDNGCNGGLMDNAFKWIQSHNGLCTESSYPYVSGEVKNQTVSKCSNRCSPVSGSTVKSIVDVGQDENSLMAALSKQPVSIAIEADKLGFQLYRSGIYSGNCGNNLDHGVLAVGYGDGYWLVKNSWGELWGDEGYIKIARGNGKQGGECGILLSASYPIL